MDSNIAENIVLYDWLSFTSKTHTPEQLIAVAKSVECDQIFLLRQGSGSDVEDEKDDAED